MKKFFLFVALALIVLAGVAYFALPSLVEKAIRQNLAQLPATLNQPGVAVYSPPEVGKISFEPLGRKLEIDRATIRCKLEDRKLGQIDAIYRLNSLEGIMPWRLLLLISPLSNLAGAPNEFETVLTSLVGKDISISMAGDGFQLETAANEFSGQNVMLQGNLLGSILNQLPLDSLDLVYGMGADKFSLKDLGGNITLQKSHEVFVHKIKGAELVGWRGRVANRMDFTGLDLQLPNNDGFGIESFVLEKITLPEMPLMVALQQDIQNESPFGAMRVMGEILKGAPIVSHVRLTGLAGDKFNMGSAKLDWLSASPPEWNFSAQGIKMPASVFEEETGLSLQGMKELILDCDLAAGKKPDGLENYRGSIMSGGLGTLAWTFDMSTKSLNLVSLMGAKISDFNLNYADGGLVPRVANGVAPNAQAAMFALKIAAGHFCAAQGPQNEALRNAVESFVERPGNLVIKARKPFSMAEIGIEAYRGDLGSIFEATATPGQLTLEQAMEAVKR